MPNTLFLRLPHAHANADYEWLSLDEFGGAGNPRQRGPLSLAAAVARNAKVVILVPASEVLMAEPELPPGNGTKLARAVPFALEEQLTEDVDHLYFALGRRRETGGTPVAVVSRQVMQAWMSTLKSAGIEPNALYVDLALMPDNPGATVLWFEGGRLGVRRPGSLPFSVELTPLADALILAGVIADPHHVEVSAEQKPLENIILYVTREDWVTIKAEFENLSDQFESLKIQLLADGPLPWLGREQHRSEAVNLLQGEFARSTDYSARWQRWRVAAYLGVGLLVAHLLTQGLQIRKAQRQASVLDGEIFQVFNAAMPGEKMLDARHQMQTRLDRIRKTGIGPQVFLHTMQALSASLANTPNTSIESLSFRESTLDMKMSAPSLDALSKLSQAVASQGIQTEIQSSTPIANGVEAHVQLHNKGVTR